MTHKHKFYDDTYINENKNSIIGTICIFILDPHLKKILRGHQINLRRIHDT